MAMSYQPPRDAAFDHLMVEECTAHWMAKMEKKHECVRHLAFMAPPDTSVAQLSQACDRMNQRFQVHDARELCEGLIPCGSDAMLIADTTQSPPVVYKQAFYYYMAHVSRFVPPGSVRLGAALARAGGNGSTPVLGAAFATPANTTVLVLQNAQDTAELVAVDDPRAGSLGWAEVPAHSIVTLEWAV